MRATINRITAITFPTLFLALLAGGCSSSSGQCPFMRSDKTMIESAKKVDADFLAAFNKADVEAAAACYWNSPDVVLYPPGEMECHGWQQVHDTLAGVFKDIPGGQLQIMDPHYMVAGQDVIANGLWTVTSPNGAPLHGRFTEVIAKKDGKWVMVLDHPSVPMAK